MFSHRAVLVWLIQELLSVSLGKRHGTTQLTFAPFWFSCAGLGQSPMLLLAFMVTSLCQSRVSVCKHTAANHVLVCIFYFKLRTL
ncbi:hypothetical protein AHF37_00437 [Paragonimus kellicotti]|nr:hypothetical protein AHF37_00437 [Paragonimus kellicotti]